MEITINGKISADPRGRILAIEAVAQTICEQTGQDPADCVMMLLTAAVHISSKYARIPASKRLMALAEAIGAATVAADEMFKLRDITS